VFGEARIMSFDYEALYKAIVRRYGAVEPEALLSIMCPALIPIKVLDTTIFREQKNSPWRATFEIEINDQNYHLLQRGRTGKFVPKTFLDGEPWREVAKGRIVDLSYDTNTATGEIYIGAGAAKTDLQDALKILTVGDLLEIDQYGASAKILSALTEYYFVLQAWHEGFKVIRMPEDTAKHLQDDEGYYNFDFMLIKDGKTRRVESKSLWGTDTRFARLIHSKTKGYETSSCKFLTQDIFSVSLFLKTGNITDFAFAVSVPEDRRTYGLPRTKGFPDYVNQNPVCEFKNDNPVWFRTISEVWDLDSLRDLTSSASLPQPDSPTEDVLVAVEQADADIPQPPPLTLEGLALELEEGE
jgi:hypothetical protein